MSKEMIHIRFPNESYYDEVYNFKLDDFQLIKTFQYDVFGIWNDTHILIMKQDYDKLLHNERTS